MCKPTVTCQSYTGSMLVGMLDVLEGNAKLLAIRARKRITIYHTIRTDCHCSLQGTSLSFSDFGDFPIFAVTNDTFMEVLEVRM